MDSIITRDVAALVAQELNRWRGSTAHGSRVAVGADGTVGSQLYDDRARPPLKPTERLLKIGPTWDRRTVQAAFR